ncbi:uncharacterized protein VTP21DRAFT_4193 [Calcarisporiella thermophila]|uniref:uncharacterized protein n=1 Tax=Calcarisporiella thermophila TaxID=911321 RepID=UPI003742FC01
MDRSSIDRSYSRKDYQSLNGKRRFLSIGSHRKASIDSPLGISSFTSPLRPASMFSAPPPVDYRPSHLTDQSSICPDPRPLSGIFEWGKGKENGKRMNSYGSLMSDSPLKTEKPYRLNSTHSFHDASSVDSQSIPEGESEEDEAARTNGTAGSYRIAGSERTISEDTEGEEDLRSTVERAVEEEEDAADLVDFDLMKPREHRRPPIYIPPAHFPSPHFPSPPLIPKPPPFQPKEPPGAPPLHPHSGQDATRIRQLEQHIEQLTLQNVRLQRTNRLLKADADTAIAATQHAMEEEQDRLRLQIVRLQRSNRLLSQELDENVHEIRRLKKEEDVGLAKEYQFLAEKVEFLHRQLVGENLRAKPPAECKTEKRDSRARELEKNHEQASEWEEKYEKLLQKYQELEQRHLCLQNSLAEAEQRFQDKLSEEEYLRKELEIKDQVVAQMEASFTEMEEEYELLKAAEAKRGRRLENGFGAESEEEDEAAKGSVEGGDYDFPMPPLSPDALQNGRRELSHGGYPKHGDYLSLHTKKIIHPSG